MFDFDLSLKRYLSVFEERLPLFLPGADSNRAARAMSYSLLSGGKRIRAVLLMACYNLFESDFAASLPFAAAIEMVHAYSLIHDDLPCMDDDDLRRGKPSCHIAFGEATAVLAGDGLLTLAFETMARKENLTVFGADKILAAIRSLSCAAGVGGMVGGQVMDMENESRGADLDRLIATDEKKTGALVASACEIGCILGGAGESITAKAVSFAKKLGLAFQITDDILDVTADEAVLGKPVGSDKQSKKPTYASVYGTEKAAEIAAGLTEEAVGLVMGIGLNTEFLCGLAKMLAARER